MALPARFITQELGLEIVRAYMAAEYEGGRHQRRVDKIPC
ncbi:RpiB/LacA/LacB family sugar-phosphate isomerase [Salibacteraceae bacterium]|nr:RpiB/LacA/LacB family sugar-phosphate isomerase [Salibacteraceae bacterium]